MKAEMETDCRIRDGNSRLRHEKDCVDGMEFQK